MRLVAKHRDEGLQGGRFAGRTVRFEDLLGLAFKCISTAVRVAASHRRVAPSAVAIMISGSVHSAHIS